MQRDGFESERDAAEALERLRREHGLWDAARDAGGTNQGVNERRPRLHGAGA